MCRLNDISVDEDEIIEEDEDIKEDNESLINSGVEEHFKKPEPHESRIEDLEMTVRAFNSLKSLKINTIEEMINMDIEQLGEKSKVEILKLIEEIKNKGSF